MAQVTSVSFKLSFNRSTRSINFPLAIAVVTLSSFEDSGVDHHCHHPLLPVLHHQLSRPAKLHSVARNSVQGTGSEKESSLIEMYTLLKTIVSLIKYFRFNTRSQLRTAVSLSKLARNFFLL